MRCIAGLETPDSGSVRIGGREVTELRPAERNVGMVFQDFALYPHLTAFENIAFGLRARKASPAIVRSEVAAAAAALDLEPLLQRKPGELSGGERQRVALARALVRHPDLFLMDEPLSNLDAELRARARTELRLFQQRLAVTAIYVTHDQTEAMSLADRVAVVREGRVEQVAAPLDLYRNPASIFVARFIGAPGMNVVPGGVLTQRANHELAGIRPEHVSLVEPAAGRVKATVEAVEMTGPDALVHVAVQGHRIAARCSISRSPAPGDEVGLFFDDLEVRYFDQATGEARQ